MSKLTPPPARVAKWDNTKFFLILCVVMGHSANNVFIVNGDAMKWMEICLYSFHMPLFIFLGGLFAKKTINSVPFRYEKVISYMLLSLFMKLLNYTVTFAIKGKATFQLLSDNSVSWYIFVMAVHIMIAHLLRNCKPWKILAASFTLAILIGYVSEIGNVFVLSRIIVFFPVFWLGYILDPEKLLSILNKPWVRICSAVFLVAIFIFFYFTIDYMYFFRRLFTGNNPYYEFGGIKHLLGGPLRICSFTITFLVSFALLSVMPNKRIPLITWCGGRTLTVYALHRPVQYIIGFTFFNEMFKDTLPRFLLPILLVYAFVLTVFLSMKCFDYVLYPCMNWDKILAPVMNWFRKDEYKKINK